MKWFPPNKTGKVAGIVVSGFGLASVYIAPLADYLLNNYSLQQAMLFFGIAFLLVVCVLATLLKNPPDGFVPSGFVDRRRSSEKGQKDRAEFVDINLGPVGIMKTGNFWLLWFLYFIGAGAGLMVIGSVAGMAKASLGNNAFVAVALLAVGNAGGRIIAGIMSDKIGRSRTLAIVFLSQAALMFLAMPLTGPGSSNALLLVLLATMIGFNYGANLAIFPTFTKDLWGITHFGVNYGLIFTAWGIGGFVMSKASQYLLATSGTFSSSLATAGGLLIIGAVLTLFIKDYKADQRRKISST
jgi:nitrate/nitrite transporter NarK